MVKADLSKDSLLRSPSVYWLSGAVHFTVFLRGQFTLRRNILLKIYFIKTNLWGRWEKTVVLCQPLKKYMKEALGGNNWTTFNDIRVSFSTDVQWNETCCSFSSDSWAISQPFLHTILYLRLKYRGKRKHQTWADFIKFLYSNIVFYWIFKRKSEIKTFNFLQYLPEYGDKFKLRVS